jgi:hypothetical protein
MPSAADAQLPFSAGFEGGATMLRGAEALQAGPGYGVHLGLHVSEAFAFTFHGTLTKQNCAPATCLGVVQLTTRQLAGGVRLSREVRRTEPWIEVGYGVTRLEQVGEDGYFKDLSFRGDGGGVDVSAGVGLALVPGFRVTPLFRYHGARVKLDTSFRDAGQPVGALATFGDSRVDGRSVTLSSLTLGVRISVGPVGPLIKKRRLRPWDP